MKVLVTGGAGFVGSNLCRHLATARPDWTVSVIDDLSTGTAQNLADLSVELHQASILNRSALTEASQDADAIVHLAAVPSVPRSMRNPRASHEAITDGTLNVLEIARESDAHVIYASSSSVYGANDQIPKIETMLPMPVSPYAAAKLAGETYTLAWGRAFALDTLAFRFFNIYGPGQSPHSDYAAVVPAFLSRALKGLSPVINGNGSQTRDFTYVQTVCEVLTAAIERRVSSNTPINLAFGTRTSLNILLSLIEDHLGHPVSVEFAPEREGDVPHSSADSSTLLSLFPEIVPLPLEQGIAQTAEWLRLSLASDG